MRSFAKGLEITQPLAAADPADADAQHDLLIAHAHLGQARRSARQFAGALASFDEALAITGQLKAEQKLPEDVDALIVDLTAERKHTELAVIALGDWERLLKQPANMLPELLHIRGQQLTKEGRVAEAIQAVSQLRLQEGATGGQLYDAACVFSRSAASIQAPEGKDLTAEQAAQRQAWISDALAALKQALAAGWTNLDHVRLDPDLAILRDFPEYQALVQEP